MNFQSIKPPISRLTEIHQYFDPLSKALMKLENQQDTQDQLINLGIYISTNEVGSEAIYQRCLSEAAVKDACHIGFSGWFNLNIMALRRSTRAILCDFNPENNLFFDFTIKFLMSSSTKEEFLIKIKNYINTYDYYVNLRLSPDELRHSIRVCPSLFNVSPLEEIDSYVTSEYGWLHTEERFQHIKRLAITGKIAPITLDIRDVEKFKKIKNLLQDNSSVTIDTVYLSNIYHYISDEDRPMFLQTIRTLCIKNTLLIDAIGHFSSDLTQRLQSYDIDMTDEQVLERWPITQTVRTSLDPSKKLSTAKNSNLQMFLLAAFAFVIIAVLTKWSCQNQMESNTLRP